MSLIVDTFQWLADPVNWANADGIPARTVEHLWLATVGTGVAILIAVPLALYLGHARKGEVLATWVLNIGRAIPSFGIIVAAALLFIGRGVSLRFWPIVLALVALAVPPLFTNTYAAMRTIPAAAVEAGRAMGMSELQLLGRVELPMGASVILTGLRIAFIQVVATVALGAIVSSGGGLGQYVVRGFASGAAGRAEALAGALLIITLTLAAQAALTLVARTLLPPGVRRLVKAGDLADLGRPA